MPGQLVRAHLPASGNVYGFLESFSNFDKIFKTYFTGFPTWLSATQLFKVLLES